MPAASPQLALCRLFLPYALSRRKSIMTTLSFTLLVSLMRANLQAACTAILAANTFVDRMYADDSARLTMLCQRYADALEKQEAAAKLTFVLDETAAQLHDLGIVIEKLKVDTVAFEATIKETYTSCMDLCAE